MAIGEQRSPGLSKSCILIIVVASVERFAYKGVASNLVTYLTDVMKLSTSSAAKSVSSWSGVTSMLPLISAVLADSYWDRYSTITASSLLYVAGLGGLTLWALLYAWMPTSSLFLPLYLISIGQGGYNPSLQAFGADQLGIEDDDLPCFREEEEEEKVRKKKRLFFQWWYFGICSGSLLGNSLMSYVQDTIGWGLGFAIPTLAMMLSVVCFLSYTHLYVNKKHLNVSKQHNKNIIQVAMKNIIDQKFKLWLPTRDNDEDDEIEVELQEEKPLRDNDEFNINSLKIDEQPGVLAVKSPGVAKVILRLLPVWTMLLMFAVIFQQPPTFFTKQGMAMNHTLGIAFVIPPAMLQSVITMSIILLMPVYNKLIIPVLRLITQNDKGINVLQRMGIGMLLSVLAMIVAALVETKRVEIARKGGPIELSIFWLLPQYILLGVSDVFTVVGMQEFFYTQVPSSMRTIGIALYLSVFGAGSFLSAVLITVVELFTSSCGKDNCWFSDDMKEAELYKYYWFLAVLSMVSFLMFASVCRYYGDGNGESNESKG